MSRNRRLELGQQDMKFLWATVAVACCLIWWVCYELGQLVGLLECIPHAR